jgi:predicted CopG family antitoxin
MGEGRMTKTTIAVTQEVIDFLRREGSMGDSYDEVLLRLIAELRELRRGKGK